MFTLDSNPSPFKAGTPRSPRFKGHQAEHKHQKFSSAQAEALAALALQQDETATPVLDHQKPRGYAKIPVLLEKAGDKVSGVTAGIDFLPHHLSATSKNAADWLRRTVSPTSRQVALKTAAENQQSADVDRLLQAVEGQLPLADLYDVEAGMNPDETRRLLRQAFLDEPQLRAVVNNALTHPVIATLIWPVVAKPDLRKSLERIVAWQQERESPATTSNGGLGSHATGTSSLDGFTPSELATIPENGEIQPDPSSTPQGVGLHATAPSTESGAALAHRLQADAALMARGGRALAQKLRQAESFQHRPMTDDELKTRYFQKNQYPPLKDPHEFMVLEPEESTVTVTNRLPQSTGSQSSSQPWWKRFTPHPKTLMLDHSLPVKVTSKDPNAQLLLAALIKHQELPPIAPNTTVALRLRNEAQFKEKVFRPIVNTFRISEEIEIKDPNQPGSFRKVQLKEACLWPFIEAVLLRGEAGLGPNCKVKGSQKKCFDLLADADIYQFTSSNPALAKLLNDRLHHKNDKGLRELKAKLAAIQLAGLQYAEQVDVLDTVATFSKGFAAGVAGEQIASHIGGDAEPGENVWKNPAMWIRLAFLSLVDTIDNWYGEHGVLEADLKGMGLSNSHEDVFGNAPPEDSVPASHYFSARHATHLPGWLESLRRRVLLMGAGDADGKASQAVATTYRSVAMGGLGGMAASLYAAKTFTEAQPKLYEQMLSTSIGTLGAFSIPINFGLTLPRVMSSFNEHLEEGRLRLPPHIKAEDEKAVQAYIKEVALQEMMSRTGLQASLKSYTVIPALGLVWPAQLVIPRPVLQSVLAPFMPVAENLTRMGMMLHRVDRSFPKSLADTEGMVLTAYINDEEHMERYQDAIRRAFNGTWSRTAAQGMNVFTYPLQLAMTHRKHIDFHDGPE